MNSSSILCRGFISLIVLIVAPPSSPDPADVFAGGADSPN